MNLSDENVENINHTQTFYCENKIIKITARESACLYYLCQGLSTKETAQLLNIQPRTVEQYLVKLREKFGCRTKLALLSKALKLKILEHYDNGCS